MWPIRARLRRSSASTGISTSPCPPRTAAQADKAQRGGLAKFAAWCSQAPDAERRVILHLMRQYQGRVPMGAVADASAAAGVSRMTVFTAIRRFVSFFPGAISETRRSKG